jgi:hypothetical protein
MAAMGGNRVEVFCDGSITNAVITDPFTSHIGSEYIGRGMVLVPVRDYGLIEQTRAGVVTERGMPNSVAAESFAVRIALDACAALGIADFIVYSDCQAAVELAGHERVAWRSREQMYLPNQFFDKVLGRAGYLRHSSKVVKMRRPVEPHQTEAFDLFCAPRREFNLSASALWARVARDARRHGQALGVG